MNHKSDSEHWLKSTRPTRATPTNELPPSRPRLPKDLSEEALGVFKRLCSLLRKRRSLTAGDGELVRLYALTWERHSKAISRIQAEGEIRTYTVIAKGGEPVEVEKENLWLKVAFTAEKNMVAILDRLGFTPLNRAKPKPTAEPQEGSHDEGDAFLNRLQPAHGQKWTLPTYKDEVPDDGRTSFDV